MTPSVITAADAIAQGSTWFQIVSIASFHDRSAHSLRPKNFDRLARHKQESITQQVRTHQKVAEAIRAVADEMRRVQEGIGLNG